MGHIRITDTQILIWLGTLARDDLAGMENLAAQIGLVKVGERDFHSLYKDCEELRDEIVLCASRAKNESLAELQQYVSLHDVQLNKWRTVKNTLRGRLELQEAILR